MVVISNLKECKIAVVDADEFDALGIESERHFFFSVDLDERLYVVLLHEATKSLS